MGLVFWTRGLARAGRVAACALCMSGCAAAAEEPPIAEPAPPPPPGEVQSSRSAPAPQPTPEPSVPDFDFDAPGVSPDAKTRKIWIVDAENRLGSFAAFAPGKLASRVEITGLAEGERIVGIDFRPADGALYALGSSSRLFVLDRATGAAVAVAEGFSPRLSGQQFGFDFNPVADRARVHSDVDQNLRLDPRSNGAVRDGGLAFAAGDVNEGQSPNLVGTAYTNSVAPAPTETVLFAIDSTRNLLVRFASPNDGMVTTVGALGVDATEAAAFDIWGGDKLEAYAALRVDDETGLFSIDLASGRVARVGRIGDGASIVGLAIER